MEYVEVYYDKNDGLTLVEVCYKNNRKQIVSKLKGEKVKLCLGVLANKEVKKRVFVDNCEYIYYDDLQIKIYDSRFIREYQLLQGYLDKVDEQIKAKKAKLATKVKRKNKYTGVKIIAGGIALIILLTTSVLIMKAKKDDNPFNNDYTYSQSINKKPVSDEKDTSLTGNEAPSVTETIVSTGNSEETDTSLDDNNQNDEKIESYIYIDYDDRSDYEKADKTKELYGKTIEKYAKKYGLDPAVVIALATQERGVHSTEMDRGGATGLMQIQNSIWVGSSITAYNFETGKKETCKITKGDLADCETNIKLGCMILQDCMKQNNYNILLGLQAYNMGTWGIGRAVSAYANYLDCSRVEIINNPKDCGWMDYREGIAGDPKYIEHVLSYIGCDVDICIYKPDGTIVECSVKNYQNIKHR